MKIIRILVTCFAVMLIFCCVVSAEVGVEIDGERIYFPTQAPEIINDRVYVPLREIFESLGAYVEWNSQTQSVVAYKRFNTVSMTLGKNEYYVNSETKTMDTPPMLVNDKTMIPVRAVSEALEAEVVWDSSSQTVLISRRGGEHKIQDVYLEFWQTADDGTVILSGRIAYPQIVDTDDAICAAFNEFMSEAAEQKYQSVLNDYAEVKDFYEESLNSGMYFTPYLIERKFDITYDTNNIISVLCYDSDFTGGAHPSSEYFSLTFDLSSGKSLELGDVFNSGEAYARTLAKSKFVQMIEAQPEMYYADALSCLDNSMSELGWYLSDKGITFYLNPYVIAPYARGIAEVTVGYSSEIKIY